MIFLKKKFKHNDNSFLSLESLKEKIKADFMRRFWIDRSCLKDDEFIIQDTLYRHICQVCRIKKGEPFELFCEGLQKYEVALKSVSSSKATACILRVYPVPPLPKPYLRLALSLPRFSKIDFLLEKAVELGVKDIYPFTSRFSFIQKANKLPARRWSRWQKIVRQSLAQSARTEALNLHPVTRLQDLKIPKKELAFMAYEGGGKTDFLPKKLKSRSVPPAIWLFIGSEGGFSPQEAESFSARENSFVFSFGEQILRVETACLFGLSILKYHYHCALASN